MEVGQVEAEMAAGAGRGADVDVVGGVGDAPLGAAGGETEEV